MVRPMVDARVDRTDGRLGMRGGRNHMYVCSREVIYEIYLRIIRITSVCVCLVHSPVLEVNEDRIIHGGSEKHVQRKKKKVQIGASKERR